MQITELQGQVGQLQHALTDAERRVLEGEMVRRKLHNIIQVCVSRTCLPCCVLDIVCVMLKLHNTIQARLPFIVRAYMRA